MISLVIHTVLEICSVISNMDHALHANTWKFIIKYVMELFGFYCDVILNNECLNCFVFRVSNKIKIREFNVAI